MTLQSKRWWLVGRLREPSQMTPFERAKIRLEAFQLLAGSGTNTGDPKAENPIDRYVHTPWSLETHMQRADELAEWAMECPTRRRKNGDGDGLATDRNGA